MAFATSSWDIAQGEEPSDYCASNKVIPDLVQARGNARNMDMLRNVYGSAMAARTLIEEQLAYRCVHLLCSICGCR
jgi:hypothetical protein